MTTQGASSASEAAVHPEESTFRRLESYPFSRDPEFQSGLSTILSSNPSQDPELLILRARCFYFARKSHTRISFESYKSWRDERSLPPVSDATASSETLAPWQQANGVTSPSQKSEQGAAPYPSSFSSIVDLITKGEPIPGIKEIPDTLLTGQDSAPSTAKRKKPWERVQASNDAVQTTLEGQR